MRPVIRLWKRHFLWCELLFAIVATGAIIVWCVRFNGFAVFDAFLQSNRSAVYGTVAAILGSLLGFVITAASVVLAFASSDRLAVVRESAQYPMLWKVFTATIRWLAVATIAVLFALITDRDTRPVRPVMFAAIFSSVVATLRLARAVWVLENIISLITSPTKSVEQQQKATANT